MSWYGDTAEVVTVLKTSVVIKLDSNDNELDVDIDELKEQDELVKEIK